MNFLVLRAGQPQYPLLSKCDLRLLRLLLVAADDKGLPHGGHQQMGHTLATICDLGPPWPNRTYKSLFVARPVQQLAAWVPSKQVCITTGGLQAVDQHRRLSLLLMGAI